MRSGKSGKAYKTTSYKNSIKIRKAHDKGRAPVMGFFSAKKEGTHGKKITACLGTGRPDRP
jgi:hypothetical protein